jgi:quercetin dioxygenase-like cupin family protein
VAAFHSHKERPALTYIMKDSLTEHRKGGPDRTYKAGEVLTESADVDHWAENTTAEPVTVISADLFKEQVSPRWDRRKSGGKPAVPITHLRQR